MVSVTLRVWKEIGPISISQGKVGSIGHGDENMRLIGIGTLEREHDSLLHFDTRNENLRKR